MVGKTHFWFFNFLEKIHFFIIQNLGVGEVCDPENDKCDVSFKCHTKSQGKGICVPQCNFDPLTDGCFAGYAESKPNDKGVCSCEKCPESKIEASYSRVRLWLF